MLSNKKQNLSDLIKYSDSSCSSVVSSQSINNDDTEFYAKAMKEVEDPSSRNQGLWAKAFCEHPKDDALAKALYIKMRVGQMVEIRNSEARKA